MPNDCVRRVGFIVCQRIPFTQIAERRSPDGNRLFAGFGRLERLHVFSLPTLGTLRYVELHRLAFLQAFETARLDRREVYKNILAILAADETIAFGVVEPLYCSFFHIRASFPYLLVTLERVGRNLCRLLAVEARTAHDRFGLTHT